MELIPGNKDEKIEQLTRDGYSIEISKLISEAFEIFKKNTSGFVFYTILIFIIESVFGSVFAYKRVHYLGSYPFSYNVTANLFGLISPVFSFGIALVARKMKFGEKVSFSDFFDGFRKTPELFLGNLLAALLMALGFICLIIPGIYLAVCYSFVSYFLWFNKTGGYWDTLEKCRKFISREWWKVLLFFLALLGINILGLLCLVVGLLVTIPVSSIAVYLLYENTIGTNEDVTIPTSTIS